MGKANQRKTHVPASWMRVTCKHCDGVRSWLRSLTLLFSDPNDLPPEREISWPLADMLQEEVSDDPTLEGYQSKLAAIVSAWNISSQLEDERRAALRKQIKIDKSLPPEKRREITRITVPLVLSQTTW